MTKKYRFLTSAMVVIIMIAMLSSAAFIVIEADHDCLAEDCVICHQISICENILKSFGSVTAVAVLAAVMIYTLHRMNQSCAELVSTTTLVSLKVELLN